MDDGDAFGKICGIEPDVRRLLSRAGVATDKPDQVVRGFLILTATAIVRLARTIAVIRLTRRLVPEVSQPHNYEGWSFR